MPSPGQVVVGRVSLPQGRLIAALAVLTLACGTEPAAPGSRIAFLGFLPETVSLFSMESDGRDVRRLSDTTLLASNASWSPDGRRLVFSANPRDGEISNLYLVNADGTGLRPVLANGADNREPVWSPDGKRIAFTSFRTDSQHVIVEAVRIWVMQADGSNAVPITEGTTASWSADSRRLVFVREVSDDGITTGLFLVNSDGSGGVVPLTDPRPLADTDGYPDWSPSGDFIAFTRTRLGSAITATTWVIRPDGSGLRELATTSPETYQPSWSPDETEIVVSDASDGQLKAVNVANPATVRLFGSLPATVNDAAEWGPAR